MGNYTASTTHPYRQHQNWNQNRSQNQNYYQNLSQSLSPGLTPIRHYCRLSCLGNPD
jgi:hypothetical protein